jgi:hypothetical protein
MTVLAAGAVSITDGAIVRLPDPTAFAPAPLQRLHRSYGSVRPNALPSVLSPRGSLRKPLLAGLALRWRHSRPR